MVLNSGSWILLEPRGVNPIHIHTSATYIHKVPFNIQDQNLVLNAASKTLSEPRGSIQVHIQTSHTKIPHKTPLYATNPTILYTPHLFGSKRENRNKKIWPTKTCKKIQRGQSQNTHQSGRGEFNENLHLVWSFCAWRSSIVKRVEGGVTIIAMMFDLSALH